MDDSGTTGILCEAANRVGGAEISGRIEAMHQAAQEWSEALLRCMDQRTTNPDSLSQASSDPAPE
jgi:hypothetical protein